MFNTVQAFRNNATEEDYIELKDFYYQSKNKNKDFKESTYYGFSCSAALNLIREHFNSDEEQEEKTEGIRELIITRESLPDGKFKQVTLSLKESTLKKYQDFCDKYSCYSKQAILTLLLEKGLEFYEE